MSSSSIRATEPFAATLPGLAPHAGAGPDDEVRACLERAGRLLARRARTETDLRNRLAGAGFAEETIAAALARLRELRLVDDADFARRWVEERAATRGLGRASLIDELRERGVEVAVAEAAVDAAGLDEEARAVELATALLDRWRHKPLERQASSLWQALCRKGYSSETAIAAVKAVLPPEGWD